MKEVTERQRQILDFIHRFARSNGYAPSIREIGTEFEISSIRGVTVHLDGLERKGCLTRRPGAARSLAVTASGLRTLKDASPVRPCESQGGCARTVTRIVKLITDERDRHVRAVQEVDPALTGAIKRLRYTAGVIQALANTISETFKDATE